MCRLIINDKTVSTHLTLDDAFTTRNAKIREICYQLYNEGIIDKYSVNDWCFGLNSNRDMEFYLDENGGYYVNIEKS